MSISNWTAMNTFKPDPTKALLYFGENPRILEEERDPSMGIYDTFIELTDCQRNGLLRSDLIFKLLDPLPRIVMLFEEIRIQMDKFGLEKIFEFSSLQFQFLEYKDIASIHLFDSDLKTLSEIADPCADFTEVDYIGAHKIIRAIYQLRKSDIAAKFSLPKPSDSNYISKTFNDGSTLFLIQKKDKIHDKFIYIVALEVPIALKMAYDDELNTDSVSIDFPSATEGKTVTLEVIIEPSGAKEMEVVPLPDNNTVITDKLIRELFLQYFPHWDHLIQEGNIVEKSKVDIIPGSYTETETIYCCKFKADTFLTTNVTSIPPHLTPPDISVSTTESLPQREVASRIFKRVAEVLVGDESYNEVTHNNSLANKLKSKFQRIHFMILVPKYNTLRQQNRERIEKYHHLVREGESSTDFVYLYGIAGGVHLALEKFKSQILSHDNELFVLIVDECHFAPTKEAIPILHQEEVTSRDNFIVLLVSATPYNCLSDQSQVAPENLIRWDIQDETTATMTTISKPCYAGFEYYFRSLAFSLNCHSPTFSLTYTSTTTSTTTNQNGENNEKTVIISLPLNKEYGSFTCLADTINKSIEAATKDERNTLLKCRYNEEDGYFSFHLENVRATVSLKETYGNNMLSNLGFNFPFKLDNANKVQNAGNNNNNNNNNKKNINIDNNIKIDNLCSVESQHLRQDKGLKAMCDNIVKYCPELLRVKKITNRLGCLVSHWDGLEGILPNYSSITHSSPLKALPDGCIMMTPKNGFTIILDYMLSMAYFGSCRVLHNSNPSLSPAHVTLKPLLSPNDNISEVINLPLFLQMLEKCCYFEGEESCNLGKALEVTLKLIMKNIQKERKKQDDDNVANNWKNLLTKYLIEKYKAEINASKTSDSESWFTETDRIIKMLLVDRGPAPMVLLRVYDNDENRSMQTILRHAIKVCKLTFILPSSNTTDISSEIDDSTSSQLIPGFSILGDISNTKLLNILEPYYKNEYKVSGEYGSDYTISQIPQFRVQASSLSGNGIIANKASDNNTKKNFKFSSDLKYEDLANIPCLIILCEKGRMGDTFPHNLRALDLRLRTGGTASCFLQEIGRMCRYPKTNTNISGNGFMIIDKTTGSLIDFTDDSERYLERNNTIDRTTINMLPLSHPLPYALIQPEVRKCLEDAIDKREEKLESNGSRTRDQDKIINYLTMKGGVDDYLSGKTIDWKYKSKLKKSNAHYDLNNKSKLKHKYRFLLAAECQIGKTGAYLHFLHLLRCAIEVPIKYIPIPILPRLPRDIPWVDWEIPYWKLLQTQRPIDYKFPIHGKYHHKLARQRLDMFFKAAKETSSGNIKDKYISLIMEYEHTISGKGLALLKALPPYSINTITNNNNTDITSNTLSQGHYLYNESIMTEYVNWDGRLSATVDSFTGARDFVGDVIFNWKDYHSQYQSRGIAFNVATEFFGNYDNDSDHSDTQHVPQEVVLSSATTNSSTIQAMIISPTDDSLKATAPLISSSTDTTSTILYKSLSNAFVDYGATGEFGLYIPLHAFSNDKKPPENFEKTSIGELAKLLISEKPPQLEYWIFTPTFSGDGKAGPEEKLLQRDNAMILSDRDSTKLTRWMDYVEVLVIRKSQLDLYKYYYGSTHILATLPDSLQKERGNLKSVVDVVKGGCGFARRYCQLLAHALGLRAIWMIDDNVQQCWQICNTNSNVIEGSLTVQPASFADVMTQIERIFNDKKNLEDDDYKTNIFEKIPDELRSKFRNTTTTTTTSAIFQKPSTMSDITGEFSAYGIIGTCRGKQWRKHITNPIKISHSVYSFFLLNVTDTVSANLLFPCRPIMEDIEFNNLLDESRLVVCKMQRFAHCKPVRPLQAPMMREMREIQPPPEMKQNEVDRVKTVEEKMCKWLSDKFSLHRNTISEKLELELGGQRYEWPETMRLYEKLKDIILKSDLKSDLSSNYIFSIITNGINPIFTSGFFKDKPRIIRMNDLFYNVCEATTVPATSHDNWVMIFPNTRKHIDTSYTTLLIDNFEYSLKVCNLPIEISEFFLVVKLTTIDSQEKNQIEVEKKKSNQPKKLQDKKEKINNTKNATM